MPLRHLLPLALLALLLTAAPVHAQAVVEREVDAAAEALRADPVYVDPDAENAISDAQADRLRALIAEAGGDIYLAILPASAGPDASAVGPLLGRAVGRPGAYGVIVGSTFAAGDNGESLRATQLGGQAREAHGDEGAGPMLEDFVARVGQVRRGEEPTGTASAGGGQEGAEGGGFGGWLLLAVLGGGAALLGLRGRRRKRERERAEAEQWEEVKDAARDDLVALGDDIRALDLDVQMPDADPRGTDDYGRAVSHYERASELFDRARRPEDLEGVTQALEEGRFAMASAKARLAGGEPPEHRAPCFFDPRHGPSAREVEWSPPGGTPRLVPACEADAQRVERGDDPATREVTVRGRRVPYYDAPPAYGPWAGGFFGGLGGGLLPGLLIGSMLGGGLGFGYPDEAAAESGDWGGGDFGGGDDWGGGDWGGGSFGGGDFGGGGFGGGGE